MFDTAQPIQWSVIVGTIVVIFAVTAAGVMWVKNRCPERGEEEQGEKR